ncbi:MAG: hypothetical protein ACK42D_02100 [Candidatus Paceibacteria bacterium]
MVFLQEAKQATLAAMLLLRSQFALSQSKLLELKLTTTAEANPSHKRKFGMGKEIEYWIF